MLFTLARSKPQTPFEVSGRRTPFVPPFVPPFVLPFARPVARPVVPPSETPSETPAQNRWPKRAALVAR